MSEGLRRFVDAHAADFERALGEIESGRKRSHWMWYVFPQVSGLGMSSMSQRYAIGTAAEADEFLADPTLGSNYRRIVSAVHRQVIDNGVSVYQLFGSPDDAKLVSSLTLFGEVARRRGDDALADDAEAILRRADAEGLPGCATTEQFLAEPD